MLLGYPKMTSPALPRLDIMLPLFSTMAVDSPSWREDALQNTARPPSAPLDLAAHSHPPHHWCWSLMMIPEYC